MQEQVAQFKLSDTAKCQTSLSTCHLKCKWTPKTCNTNSSVTQPRRHKEKQKKFSLPFSSITACLHEHFRDPRINFSAPGHFGLSVKRPEAGLERRNTLTGITRWNGRKTENEQLLLQNSVFLYREPLK